MTRASIFDAVRAVKGRIDPDDVPILDDALDRIGIAPNGARTLGSKGEALIQKWEGYAKDIGNDRVRAYPDPATGGEPWTIGWGSTGPDVAQDTIWTKAQAKARFSAHLGQFSADVNKALGGAAAQQDQFDAMVSLAYNIGIANFVGSTLLKKHKAGDYAGAAAEFARWNKAAGRVMTGLTSRRADEAKRYRGEA